MISNDKIVLNIINKLSFINNLKYQDKWIKYFRDY